MDEKNLPTWLFVAVVVGLGELTYWLYTHFGFGLLDELSLVLTVVAAIGFIVIYFMRKAKRKKLPTQEQEKFENMTD